MRAYKGEPARSPDRIMSLVGSNDGYITISVPIRASTLAKIEELRASCAPSTMTREALVRVLIETGLIHWMTGPREEEA